jgi:hypothetical protein
LTGTVAHNQGAAQRGWTGINFSRDRLEIAGRSTNLNGDTSGRVPVRHV